MGGADYPGAVRHTSSVTILDVARDAHVSQQTVSRVLRHPEAVAPGTAQRVRESIEHLGYVPNEAARELRLRRPRRIGVLAHQLRETGPSSITTAAMQALQDAGYSLDIVYVADDDASALTAALSHFKSSCSAVLAMMQTEAGRAQVVAGNLPMPVFIDAGLDRGTLGVPGVEERIGAIAAEHFHGLGHRSIVHLPGPMGSLAARSGGRHSGTLVSDSVSSAAPQSTGNGRSALEKSECREST